MRSRAWNVRCRYNLIAFSLSVWCGIKNCNSLWKVRSLLQREFLWLMSQPGNIDYKFLKFDISLEICVTWFAPAIDSFSHSNSECSTMNSDVMDFIREKNIRNSFDLWTRCKSQSFAVIYWLLYSTLLILDSNKFIRGHIGLYVWINFWPLAINLKKCRF